MRSNLMMWYEIFIDEEFLNYFGNDNNAFFTMEDEKTVLAPTFLRFRHIVYGVTSAFANQSNADRFAELWQDTGEYDILRGFNFCIEHISSLDLGKDYLIDLFHSIPSSEGQSKYDIDPNELSAEQCAVLIMYQFWGRMGERTEAFFQESGALKKYLFALKDKVDKSNC